MARHPGLFFIEDECRALPDWNPVVPFSRSGRPGRYVLEVPERIVRLVQKHARKCLFQWAAIRSIAEKIGCTHEALRRRVRQAEREKR